MVTFISSSDGMVADDKESLSASKPQREVQQHCRNQIVKRTPTRHGLEVGPRPVPSMELSELP
ncbi:predicted protein [Plenodomus lingam JN3]|uniref:Uncharacterized protein n=1 Tax=Leptosphaeria maculans (strain JN3 / isolate v23.1.3 / race Av1-4-5-6-7-8) TaxID=985895 RepID=E5A6S7_LEPMJ|nr:predicted protein [Plenodomus lingam JN3]CBX99322.1 predicted protein [Plenodomus lingam JN3]